MESKCTDKNTPCKTVQNILLEKTTTAKLGYNFTSDSPFQLMPSVSTPPSRLVKIKNPFETHLTDRLHLSVFSPSVFCHKKTDSEEKFKWAIEEISNLKPADIDEATVEQFEILDQDPDLEKKVQANIERFFNEKHIVPSPFETVPKCVPLISPSASPVKLNFRDSAHASCQTVLSLPPNLPKHVEDVLKPYFSYTIDQQGATDNNSSLYQKLFNYHETSPSSVLTSPAPSCNLPQIDFSPYDIKKASQRNFGSPDDNDRVSECNLSPIALDLIDIQDEPRSSFRSRLDSDRMSIDLSYNLVPDTLDQIPNNQSLGFESVNSPPREVLSTSSVNWDLEYKRISSQSSDSNENEMDVSNSNTPKSRKCTSQRKNLSNSFLKSDDENEDENKENIYENKPIKSGLSSIFAQNDLTDAGYHTASGLTMSEEWSSFHLFASTPSKYN